MSYIINSTSPFVSVKITDIGRQKLSMGQLNFSAWAIGDSELDYNREAIVDANPNDVTLSATSKILRPFDIQPRLKYFITPLGATTQYQPLDSSNINVVKAIVNNAAKERGFFSGTSYTTITASTYSPYYTSFANTGLNGTTLLSGLATTTGFTVGDLVLLKLNNNALTAATDAVSNTIPVPNLWFKVMAVGATDITVDRNLPNYSTQGTYPSQLIVYKGGEVYESIATGDTTAYWDSGTLSFDSASNITCHDVPVWNMNNVWGENLAGITGLTTTNLYEDYTKFGSYPYLGTKNPYLEYLNQLPITATTLNATQCNQAGVSYLDEITKAISIIHYTNNSISNNYGEFFYVDASSNKILTLVFPDLMYHRRNYSTASGTTMGMKFIATGVTQFVGSSNIQFIDLIEDPTLVKTPKVVGRVYTQLKTIVVHDEEIVAAMSYKSNRNWTLPELTATFASPSGGTSTGALAVGKTIYLTYLLNSTSGLMGALPCQTYVKLTNETDSPKDVAFKINQTDLLPYMRKIESGGYDGMGFYAHNFSLVYQIMDDTITRPDPGAWKLVDFTSTAITGLINETIDPKLLEVQAPNVTGFILTSIKNSGATTFDLISLLNMAPNVSPNDLQFGDERFFYGNLTTHIGAVIYKTIFDLRINSGQFNATTNPTRSKDITTNPPNIKISEVGIYDNVNNLVCIGKLSVPIGLVAGTTVLLELSMDF